MIDLDKLQAVRKVAFEPLQSHVTDTIVLQFGKQDLMVENVECFGKIQKNTHRRFVLVDCRGSFIYQMNLRVRCRMIFPKSKLTAVKYIVFFLPNSTKRLYMTFSKNLERLDNKEIGL